MLCYISVTYEPITSRHAERKYDWMEVKEEEGEGRETEKEGVAAQLCSVDVFVTQ